jgi:hypothetical protein
MAFEGDKQLLEGSVIVTPSAGSHTYKLKAEVNDGSMQVVASAWEPCFILVEDIGAV